MLAPTLSGRLGGSLSGRGGATASFSLDSISTPPKAAYSTVYRLRGTATKAFDVRRSSDNAVTTIGFAGSSIDTAALLSFVGSGSGFVSALYDQNGALDLTQPVTTKQPRIVNAGTIDTVGTSKPAPVYDGIDDHLFRNDGFGIVGGPNMTVGATFKLSGTSSNIIWSFGHNSATAATRNDRWYGINGADAADSPSGADSDQGGLSFKEFAGWVGRSAASSTIVQHFSSTNKISSDVMINNGATLAQKSLGATAASNNMNLADLFAVLGAQTNLTNFASMTCNCWVVYNVTLAGADLVTLQGVLDAHRT
jgi:hypothetical protein